MPPASYLALALNGLWKCAGSALICARPVLLNANNIIILNTAGYVQKPVICAQKNVVKWLALQPDEAPKS
jgi:hypothetical protein